ncbi:MAG: Asparagine synthetase [Rhodospirillales bacterium]|nr:Asparagine synthetase [Rhodospirillales bacterium]
MPGLFGVVDLKRGRGGRDLHGLSCEVARRLTRQPNYKCDLHRTEWAVFGRIGASFHDNTPWPAEPGQPAVAGILHDPLASMAHLAARRFSEASGFFAAACEDGQGLAVAVDRRGSIPIFFGLEDGLLVFAPEVKGVLAAPRPVARARSGGHRQLHGVGPSARHQTLFRAVRRLRGGQALTVDRSGSASVSTQLV